MLLILTFTSHTYRTIDLLGNKSNMEACVIMHSMSTCFSNISIVQWIWYLWQLERLWSKIWSLYFKFALCLAHPPYYRPLLAIMSPSWSLWAIIAYYRHSLNMDQFLFLVPSYWWEKVSKNVSSHTDKWGFYQKYEILIALFDLFMPKPQRLFDRGKWFSKSKLHNHFISCCICGIYIFE